MFSALGSSGQILVLVVVHQSSNGAMAYPLDINPYALSASPLLIGFPRRQERYCYNLTINVSLMFYVSR